jgi:hypothetical protein
MGNENAGKNTVVGSPDDFKFLQDPGFAAGMQNFLQAWQNGGDPNAMAAAAGQRAQFDPNAYMQAFMQAQPALFDMVGSQTGALGNQLNALAQRSSRLGGDAALQAMGGRNSGAGQAAFAEAYANPFAQAAAQTQQAQLGLYGGLANQSMGQYGQNYLADAQFQNDAYGRQMQAAALAAQQNQAYAGMYGNMASQMGQWYNPTYQYNPTAWESFWGVAPSIVQAGATVAGVL